MEENIQETPCHSSSIVTQIHKLTFPIKTKSAAPSRSPSLPNAFQARKLIESSLQLARVQSGHCCCGWGKLGCPIVKRTAHRKERHPAQWRHNLGQTEAAIEGEFSKSLRLLRSLYCDFVWENLPCLCSRGLAPSLGNSPLLTLPQMGEFNFVCLSIVVPLLCVVISLSWP